MRRGHPSWSLLPRRELGPGIAAAHGRSGPAGAVALGLFGLVFAATGLASIFFLLPRSLHEGEREGIVAAAVLGVLFTGVGLGIVLFPVVFGFFDLLLVLAALSLWLSSTRVRADRDGLRVRSGWLGAGRERRTTAGEIERFALQVGMQQGQRAFYRLEAKRRGGGTLGCGWGLPDKREALALAALLAQALGIEDAPGDPAS